MRDCAAHVAHASSASHALALFPFSPHLERVQGLVAWHCLPFFVCAGRAPVVSVHTYEEAVDHECHLNVDAEQQGQDLAAGGRTEAGEKDDVEGGGVCNDDATNAGKEGSDDDDDDEGEEEGSDDDDTDAGKEGSYDDDDDAGEEGSNADADAEMEGSDDDDEGEEEGSDDDDDDEGADESPLQESRRAAEELLEGIRGGDRGTASAIEAVGAMIAWRMGGGEVILCEAEPTERSLRLGFVHAGDDLSRHLYALHADSMELCKLEPTAEVVERDCLTLTKALDSGNGDIHIAEAIERAGVPGLEKIHFVGDGRTKRGAGWVLGGEGGQCEPAMVDRVLRVLSGALASRIRGERTLERWRDAVLQPRADAGDEGCSGETECVQSGRKAGRDLAMVKVTTSRTLEPILWQLRSHLRVNLSDWGAASAAGRSGAAGRAPAQRNQIARIQVPAPPLD